MPKIEDYYTPSITVLIGKTKVDRKVRYKKCCFKTYFNSQHLLFRLNALQNSFLVYLIERADKQNRIYVDDNVKKDYLKFQLEVLKENKPTSTNSLDKALTRFKDLGLLFSEGTVRGAYRINPKYFWAGAEKRRIELLKRLVGQRAKKNLPFKYLIDCTEAEFLGTNADSTIQFTTVQTSTNLTT